MVYIRTKKVKGENYLYLVKSKWDPKKNTSKQEIIKYLGNASDVTPDDIPPDYRTLPKINAFLSSHVGKSIEKRQKVITKVKEDVFKNLTNGNLKDSVSIYETYTKTTGLEDFYENILQPVMYEIGELWAANKLSVATEHVSSNIAHNLVNIIDDKMSKSDGKGKILLCTPVGEEHNLGCHILESYFKSKGYKVFNLSPSAPTESVIHFIDEAKPAIIFVSVTLEENIKAAQKMVKKIFENYNIPIFVGGQAVKEGDPKFSAFVIKEESLNKVHKLMKAQIS